MNNRNEFYNGGLIPSNVYKMKQEAEEKKIELGRSFHKREIERKNISYAHSVASSKDKYMVDALSKVRESDVSHDPTLTRHNGSYLYNNQKIYKK